MSDDQHATQGMRHGQVTPLEARSLFVVSAVLNRWSASDLLTLFQSRIGHRSPIVHWDGEGARELHR